jgi:hypothetical protein
MGIATGFTADHMDAIQAACIVSAATPADELILTRFDGGTIDAGNVKGIQGLKGPFGNTGPVGPGSSTDAQVAALISSIASQSQTAVDSRKIRTATDWNVEKKPGLLYGPTTAGFTPSPGFGPWVGRVLAQPGSGMAVQIAWREFVVGSTPEMWARLWTGTVWSNWNRIFYDTGWISVPLADTTTTPGMAGIVEYRVVNTHVYIRSHTVTFSTVAVGDSVWLAMPGAIIATYWPDTLMYGVGYYSNSVGYIRIGTDGGLQVHPSTGTMSGVAFSICYPYVRTY